MATPETEKGALRFHPFDVFDGATGRTCTRMILEDGDGTECGLPRGHPVHVIQGGVKYRVTLIESDSWSGQSSWTEDFDTYEQAEQRVTTVNAANVSPTAPPYYVKAKQEIEAVRVTSTPTASPEDHITRDDCNKEEN